MNPIFNRYLGASVLVLDHVVNYSSGKRPELFGRYRQELISTIATPDTIKRDDERRKEQYYGKGIQTDF